MDHVDTHTGLAVRSDLCTGCALCVISCSSIKHDIYSFANSHAYIEITPRTSAAEFEVRFTTECDACSYCLKFCAFDAITKPDGWVKAPHLAAISKQHRHNRQNGAPTTIRAN